MKKLIKVTQEDINEGIPRACELCPIALAFKRVLPEYMVSAGPYRSVFFTENPILAGYRCVMPNEAKRFIRDFDNRLPVKPFEFEVDLIPIVYEGRTNV